MTQILNDNDKLLASEYALGVLSRAEMAAAEKRFDQEPLFRQEVEDWHNRLTPLTDEIGGVTPPPAVWDAITQATQESSAQTANGLWQNLSFWRGFSFLSGGLAIASLAALLFLPAGLLITAPLTPMVAMLTSTGKTPAFMARFDPETRSVVIRASTMDTAETRVAELWLIPDDGVPRSLGLLGSDGRGNLQLSQANLAMFNAGGTLAISLEPAGGSPTGAPTGPVIASGKLSFL